jgi:hypothetical protein
MHTKLSAAVAFAVAAALVTGVATAGHAAAKQRVAIQVKGANDRQSFVLTPLTPGAIKSDTGVATFCCWSNRHIMRDGQAIDIGDPQMTLSGTRGTLVARNRIEFVDIPDGWAVVTGTWKVVRATGDYAGLSGGGRQAGIHLANGNMKVQLEGFLSSK